MIIFTQGQLSQLSPAKIFDMKKILAIIFLLSSYFSEAQEAPFKKPEYIIIVKDSIVSKDRLNEYAQAGYVKAMNKGVSDDEMNALKQKFGSQVGDDKRFIIRISLLTEEEKKLMDSAPKTAMQSKPVVNEGYILKANDRAADFTVEMLDGKKMTLADLKGKVVLLNFWATWCGPCMMEFHELPGEIIAPFKDKEFVFIPISRGETRETVAKTMSELEKKGISFNVGLDPDKKIWDKYGSSGIPKNFLIDQNGVIRYVSTGYSENSVQKLADEIKKLLQ